MNNLVMSGWFTRRKSGINYMVGGILLMISSALAFSQNMGALHDAVESQNYLELEKVINSEDINLNVMDFQARTPLMMATEMNDPIAAELLIMAGADVNIKRNNQDSPYLLAGAEGYNEILIMTLENGAKIEDTNRYGGTAIIPAAEKGHLDTVNILLSYGINPNHINNLGWTALMEAVLLGNGSSTYVEIIKALIADGADPNIPDKKGVRALQYAKERGFSEIVDLLESHDTTE